jgi:hypothetical protein
VTEQSEPIPAKKWFIINQTWILLSLAVLLAVIAWAIPSFTNEWEGSGAINEKLTPYCDFWDYAQMGRQLVRGEGFTSLFTYPINLAADTKDADSWKAADEVLFHSYWRPPLFPLMTAGIFKLNNIDFNSGEGIDFRKANRAILDFLGLWFILCVILTFFLARIWLRDQVAIISAFLLALSPSLLEYTWGGYPAPVFTAFILGIFILLSFKNRYLIIPAGILFGLGYLLRTNILFLIPALFVLRWRVYNLTTPSSNSKEDEIATDNRKATVKSAIIDIAVICGIGIIISLPWLVRNIALAGNPTYNMSNYLPVMFTPDYPGWILFRTPGEPFSPFGYMFAHPLTMLFKAVKFTAWYIIKWPGLLGWPVTIAWIVALIRIPKNFRGRTIYIFTLTALIFPFLPMILLEDSLRFFVPLIPLLIIMSSAVLFNILHNRVTKFTVCLIGIVIAIPLLNSIYSVGPEIRDDVEFPEAAVLINSNSHLLEPLDILKNRVPEAKGVILTDVADMVAWYCDRPAVWLPVYEAIGSEVIPLNMIEAIYVSPSILGLRPEPDVLNWRTYFDEDKDIPGFNRVGSLSKDNGLLYIRDNLLKFTVSETMKDGLK